MAKLGNLKKYLLCRDLETGTLGTISIDGERFITYNNLSVLIERVKTSEGLKILIR